MRVKKINVHGKYAKSILLYSHTPVDINLSLYRQLFDKTLKTVGLRSSSGMGRSKKPSHATVPLLMTTHENININWPKRFTNMLSGHLTSGWPIFKHTYIATLQRRNTEFETNIPRKGTARLQSQFLHSCFCELFIYSPDRFAYSAAGK